MQLDSTRPISRLPISQYQDHLWRRLKERKERKERREEQNRGLESLVLHFPLLQMPHFFTTNSLLMLWVVLTSIVYYLAPWPITRRLHLHASPSGTATRNGTTSLLVENILENHLEDILENYLENISTSLRCQNDKSVRFLVAFGE